MQIYIQFLFVLKRNIVTFGSFFYHIKCIYIFFNFQRQGNQFGIDWVCDEKHKICKHDENVRT